MSTILEPIVTYSQELNVTKRCTTIGYMTESAYKQEFAARLNELCDEMGVPPKGENRQSTVGKQFKVSQKGARKWLEGESVPSYERCREICEWANVNFEWLMTGNGPKKHALNSRDIEDPRIISVVQGMLIMDEYAKNAMVKIKDSFIPKDP